MEFLFLLLTAFICFFVFIFVRKFWNRNGIFTLGICGAIGANVYNSITYPVLDFGLIFGVDSIIYTLFIFCLLTLIQDKHSNASTVLLYSTIGSILFNAIIEILATLSSQNTLDNSNLNNFIASLASAFATFVALILVIKLFKYFSNKNVNIYVNFSICILVASIINSLLYFGITTLVSQSFDLNTFWLMMAGSYIGKLLSTIFALIAWFICSIIDKKCSKNKTEFENNKKI